MTTKILKKGKPRESEKLMSLREELVTQEEVMFSMRIPKQLHKEFRMKAFTDDVNMKDILIDAIRKYIGKI